jgi:hypothetical protein
MLDRSIPTRVIPFRLVKWKIWKVMFYGHWRHLFLGKNLWTLFSGSILTIFKKEKLHGLWNSFCNISTIKVEKNLKFVSNSVFPFITYPFLLIDFSKYKFKFIYLMSIHLTFLRYSQGAPTKKQTHFYWKF